MAFVAAAYNSASFSATIPAFALNVGSNAGRGVLVFAAVYGTADTTTVPSDVKYAGVSLTAGTQVTATGGQKGRLYYGLTSATGSNNIEVTFSNSNSIVFAQALCYDSVDGTTPFSGEVTAASVSASTTVSKTGVVSASGDTVAFLGLLPGSAGTNTFSATGGATTRVGSTYGWAADKAGATSTDIAGTLSVSEDWFGAAISIKAAAGGGGGSSTGAAMNYLRQL